MSDKHFSLQSTASHASILELLDAYSTGELTSAEKLLVERHLEHCVSCQQFLQDTQHLHALLSVHTYNRLHELSSVSEVVMQEIQAEGNGLVPIQSFEKLSQPSSRKVPTSRILISIAAVLIAAILVGSYLLVVGITMPVSISKSRIQVVPGGSLQSIPTATTTPHAAVILAKPLTQKDILWSVHMFDENTGWATNQRGILRTSDGGMSWHKVSPPGDYDFGLGVVNFFSSQIAWVAVVNNVTQRYSTFVTSDGGQSWLHNDALASQITLGPSVGITDLSVISAQECWIFATVASVKNGLGSVVLHTIDGGKSWTVLPINASTTPMSVIGTFLNSRTGWFTNVPSDNNGNVQPSLFVTYDGGVSWREQKLALPKALVSGSFDLPTFLSTKEGFLPLTFTTTGATASSVLVYTTHDAGVSWNASTVLPLSALVANGAISLDFWSDTPQIWGMTEISRTLVNGNVYQDHPIVHLTQDGGKSWSQVKSGDLFQVIGGITFLSSVDGWALGVPGKSRIDEAPLPPGTPRRIAGLLLKTSDGGRTWQAMPLVVK